MNRSTKLVPTQRTVLKRLPERGAYGRNTIYNILDEGLVCHVGFIVNGEPIVIPMAYARAGNTLYIHGSVASRMLRTLASDTPTCVTVTLLDGLVLARSAFHHSMNYRSVVVFGTASVVKYLGEKLSALRAISEHIMPGRWADVRKPSKSELKKTLVLRLPLAEASAKIRRGPPVDEEADYSLRVWAGEVPLSFGAGEPVADPRLLPGVEAPGYIRGARIQIGGDWHSMKRMWSVRLAREEDASAIEMLIRISARVLQSSHYSEAQIDGAIGSVFGVDHQLILDRTYFLAEHKGQIVGCGGWSKRRTLFGGDAMKTGMDIELDPKRDSARIRAFFVHPRWARRGIGRAILKRCEKAIQLAGFRSVELVATLTGVPFYVACRYSQGESFEVPLPNGLTLPVVRMIKQL
jgi:nitroimidazol reductase NimA-like FMN-containing flavoprotein (pyridoxamine 5'-phosphate oxidase superfamily)/GNAT superfamily N-acetyltransferase